MESPLKEVTVLSSGDVTAALDAIATRSSNKLTAAVIASVRRVGLGIVTTYWPSQQIIKITTRK